MEPIEDEAILDEGGPNPIPGVVTGKAQRRPLEDGGTDRSDVSRSQGTLRIASHTRSWREAGTSFPSDPQSEPALEPALGTTDGRFCCFKPLTLCPWWGSPRLTEAVGQVCLWAVTCLV